MKIWKRNAVISCIVLFVCVALYLSWEYGRENEPGTVFDPIISQTPGEVVINTDPLASEPAGPVNVGTDYFSETRLARMQARDNALTILNQAASNTDASQAVLDNVTHEIERLADNAMSEANIETLVRAQGFTDCVAYINQEGITVVVSEPIGGLTAPDVAKIKDIIIHETDLSVADITIRGTEA